MLQKILECQQLYDSIVEQFKEDETHDSDVYFEDWQASFSDKLDSRDRQIFSEGMKYARLNCMEIVRNTLLGR